MTQQISDLLVEIFTTSVAISAATYDYWHECIYDLIMKLLLCLLKNYHEYQLLQ